MIRNDQALSPTTRLIRGYSFEPSTYRTRRNHGTPNWLVIYTISGAGELSGQSCEKNSLAIIPPKVPQEYGTAERSSHWEILWFHAVLEAAFHSKMSRVVSLREPTVLIPQISQSYLSQMRTLIDLPETENDELRGMNIVENLVLDLSEEYAPSTQNSNQQIISQVQSFIQSNLSEPLSVDDLALSVNRSPSRLRAIFEQEGFPSPREMVEQIKMQKAASFLKFSSMKISTISSRLGFSSPFYFSLRFKKEFGVSPSEYREKV